MTVKELGVEEFAGQANPVLDIWLMRIAAVLALALALALVSSFAIHDAADAKQSVSAEMERLIEKGISRGATTIYVKQGRKITRTAVDALARKVRHKKAANIQKISNMQVWGPSGSKYASFVKVKYRSAKQQKKLARKVNSIAKKLTSSMSQAEKAALIHDAINEGCVYDRDSYQSGRLAPNSGNAYGCLINGKCVCAGYAEAFQLVALKAGLKCVCVRSSGHAWNLVRIDGKWYHIDLCWDDTGGDGRRWFLKGSNMASKDQSHKIKFWHPSKVSVSKGDYTDSASALVAAGTQW